MAKFDNVVYEFIGTRIRHFREQKEMTQLDLSEKTGLNRATISNIESGKQQTSVHLIYHICDALDIDHTQVFPLKNELEELKEYKTKLYNLTQQNPAKK